MASRRRRVIWSLAAATDLAEIAAYLGATSPDSARQMMKRLQSRAATLRTSPARGRIVPETHAFGIRVWRELIVRPYRIVYRVEGRASVVAAAVLDGRRDLENLLLERLTRFER
jgi:plasmid stabilization system protein ParE